MPFTRCDNTELINIYNTNSMSFLESLPNIEIVTETTSFSDFSSNDIGKELPSKTSCKYYSVNEYQRLNKKMNLNIFRSNINGLGSKVDNLYKFLSGTSTKMDILAITETSEKEDIGFLSNVEMEGYEKYHTASKSAKGGTAIYVSKNFDKIECIEIKTKIVKISCGCIYRHPHNNLDEFFMYLEMCLATLAKENKEVYIYGDFNLDLLKIDT